MRGTARVLDCRRRTDDDVGTTWITASELFYGAAKSDDPDRSRAQVEAFLGTLPVIGLDAAAAQVFGEAKALLEKRGRRLADADLLIAAVAITQGATLVTGNRKHYDRIPGVIIEDWIRA